MTRLLDGLAGAAGEREGPWAAAGSACIYVCLRASVWPVGLQLQGMQPLYDMGKAHACSADAQVTGQTGHSCMKYRGPLMCYARGTC